MFCWLQVTDSGNQDPKATATNTLDTEKTTKTESVSKLSDIVKSNIHELSKLADSVKITKASNTKESADKSSYSGSASKNHSSNKTQVGHAYPKVRPTSLTNGVHPDGLTKTNKPAGRPSASVLKPVDGASGKSSESAARKDSLGEPTTSGPDPKATSGVQVSSSVSPLACLQDVCRIDI